MIKKKKDSTGSEVFIAASKENKKGKREKVVHVQAFYAAA
jgi:hypothetical protein